MYDESNYQNDIMKKRCENCKYEFFTHYVNKRICPSCDLENYSTQTVKDWEK